MVKLLALALTISFVFLHTTEAKTLLCARCNSKKDHYKGECQNDPPVPTRCSGGSTVDQFCIIAKEYAKNGSLMGFVRDCSVTANADTCRELNSPNPKSPAKICITSCGTTGCNGATHLGPPPVIFFLALLGAWMLK